MDLDVLKKNWQQSRPEDYKYDSAYFLSSCDEKSISTSKSVTKRLFIFSLSEFVFWGLIGIGFQLYFKEYELQSFIEFKPLVLLEKFNYLALGSFILAFLITYKSINTNNSVKNLMLRILNTKKIINYYIYYNILVFIITFLIGFIWELFNNDEISRILQNKDEFIYGAIIIFGTVMALAFGIIIYKTYTYIYEKLINNFDKLYDDLNELN